MMTVSSNNHIYTSEVTPVTLTNSYILITAHKQELCQDRILFRTMFSVFPHQVLLNGAQLNVCVLR